MSIDVQALRDRLGWSRRDLARFLNVAPLTVARWEDGRSPPTGTSRLVLGALHEAIAQAPEVALPRLQRGARLGGLGALLVFSVREVLR